MNSTAYERSTNRSFVIGNTLFQAQHRHLVVTNFPELPFTLRLVVCQVRLPDETLAAEWYLLSNVPAELAAAQLAE